MTRTAAILSIGDELTLGQTLDTNSRWLSIQLLSRGITPFEHVTIVDDRESIATVMRRLLDSANIVIASGGLGPTPDDLTRAGLADALDAPLVEDPEALNTVTAWFTDKGRRMPRMNRVQALRPQPATMLPNTRGTAPGLYARTNSGASIFCLPGPPHELHAMFEHQVVPRLGPPTGQLHTAALHTFGLGESLIAERLGSLLDRDRNPTVGTTASRGIVSCRIRSDGPPLDDTISAIEDKLEPYIFGRDEATLASVVLDLARTRRETLATAESCTGGMIGGSLTDIPGSSDVFTQGWITYTNEAKQREFGVPAGVFVSDGAVSRACALAMATGGRQRANVDHCLAVTGIAGPGGGSQSKPVGTVWIARASKNDTEARCFSFPGDRSTIRIWSVHMALAMLRFHLVGAHIDQLIMQTSNSSNVV